ncbi:MAG: hypothetical protein JWM87_564 [Candidatus Eremiobacteraeota bacterium]|nr:hypothetical protein [Candidatus Eremiobacteraeota bacterium]
MRVAILAVHGVIPQTRYGFQDGVATALADRLSRFAKSGTWVATVIFPATGPSADPVANERPTVVRVHRANENASTAIDAFDVHEAFWSPIDKGKTTAASVLGWLLRTIFLPFNTTARYLERPEKVIWDIAFILTTVVLGAALLAGAFAAFTWALGSTLQITSRNIPDAGFAWHWPFVHADYGAAWDVLMHPTSIPARLGPRAVFALVLGIAGAFLGAQAVRAAWSIGKNARDLLRDPIQFTSRILATAILLALSLGGLLYCYVTPVEGGHALSEPAVALVLTFLALSSGRTLVVWFIANFFGDVQIYTTRDENSEFFALRDTILKLVMRSIFQLIDGSKPVRYERVYVLAHSLGSTIAMDAILHLHTLMLEGAVKKDDMARIRGFVTFGTSLEKTKYFTNVWSPTLSQPFQEWRDDLYGVLFTANHNVLAARNDLANGIYWLNCWNFTDFVSDGISSYRSVIRPGESLMLAPGRRATLRNCAEKEKVAFAGRLVAMNRERWGPFNPLRLHVVTHSDYVDDDWFWIDAGPDIATLDVVTAGFTWTTIDPAKLARADKAAEDQHERKMSEVPEPARTTLGEWYEPRSRRTRHAFWTNDVLK